VQCAHESSVCLLQFSLVRHNISRDSESLFLHSLEIPALPPLIPHQPRYQAKSRYSEIPIYLIKAPSRRSVSVRRPSRDCAMADYALPPVSTLPTLSATELAAFLDHLFEPCIPLHTLSIGLLSDQTFSSYDDCITSIGIQLTALAESASTSDTQWLETILGAHPRLGEKNISSRQSQGEQAQLASADEGGQDQLVELNALYERTFPGLRYV